MNNPLIILFAVLFISVMQSCCKPDNDKITDADGNVYSTVTIGKQVWMAENLKVTRLNDGTILSVPIPLEAGVTKWWVFTSPAYCWYNCHNPSYNTYKDTYGCLYNWYAVQTSKLCPAGWHVPGDEEWTTLSDYLGGSVVAGSKLKETGNTHWQYENADATNESGFTALPGGYADSMGDTPNNPNPLFWNMGYTAHWWTSTATDENNAFCYSVSTSNGILTGYSSEITKGFSVRCVKD